MHEYAINIKMSNKDVTVFMLVAIKPIGALTFWVNLLCVKTIKTKK